jgi:hypothetical protein
MPKRQPPRSSRNDRIDRRRTRATRDRQLSVRGVRRTPPDLRRLSRAVIEIALAQAEAEAAAQAEGSTDIAPDDPGSASDAPDARRSPEVDHD